MTSPASNRPILLPGSRVPFDRLAPGDFQQFVLEVMPAIGEKHGWRNFRHGGDGPDGGFDIAATRTSDGARVCIQVKRYGVLSVPEVAAELAKVALHGVIEHSTPAVHVIVTSGALRDVLHKAMREHPLGVLLERTRTAAADLGPLLASVAAEGVDANAAIEKYVREVDLVVWGAADFDGQLTRVWSEIVDVLERRFVASVVIREHPRPVWDELGYLERVGTSASAVVDLPLRFGNLPSSVRASVVPDRADRDARPPDAATELASETLMAGLDVLVASSGGGKTTALEAVLARAAKLRSADVARPLPVLVRLAAFRGNGHRLVDAALGIRAGSWRSLPGPFMLLLDGLDEVPRSSLAELELWLDELVADGRVRAVLSTRPSGPDKPIRVPAPRRVMVLEPVGPGHALDLARRKLRGEEVAAFVEQWSMSTQGTDLLRLPQALAVSLLIWNEVGRLPATRRELAERLLVEQARREQERFGALPEHLADVPSASVRDLASRVAWDAWFVRQLDHLTEAEAHEEVKSALASAQQMDQVGLERVTPVEAVRLLVFRGLLVQVADGFRFPHATLAALFASTMLAERWLEVVDSLRSRHGDEAWVLAAPRVAHEDRPAYLQRIVDEDPVLAARCAVEAGWEAAIEPELLRRARGLEDEGYPLYEACLALEALRTPAAVELLRSSVTRPGWFWPARRSLARLGDEAVVRQILPNVERSQAGPGEVRGGETDLWFHAPPTLRLRLARERLDAGTAGPLAASFDALATWGSEDDVERLDAALRRGGQTLKSVARGLRALHTQHPARARELLAEAGGEATRDGRVHHNELADVVGEPVDQRFLLDLLCDPPPSSDAGEAKHQDWLQVRDRACDLLCRAPLLADDVGREVGTRLPDAPEQTRWWMWRIATDHQLPDIAGHALRILADVNAPDFDRSGAARWFATQPLDSEVLGVARTQATAATGWCALDLQHLLVVWGATEDAGAVVRREVARLCYQGKVLELQPWAPAMLRVLDTIPIGVLEEFVRLDVGCYGRDLAGAQLAAARSLGDAAVDSILKATTDKFPLLHVASALGTTPFRIARAIDLLPAWLAAGGYPAGSVDIFRRLWCPAIAAALLDGAQTWVRRGPTRDPSEDVRDLLLDVASHEEIEHFVVPAAARAASPTMQRALQFVVDATRRSVPRSGSRRPTSGGS